MSTEQARDGRVPSGLVVVDRLAFRYPSPHRGAAAVTALRNISLRVEPGTCLGLMGAGGSGKSTLCLALNGLVPRRTGGSFGGSVTVGGWDTQHRTVAEMAARVGMVFQDPDASMVASTVEDEVAFGPEQLGVAPAEIEDRLVAALAVVGLGDHRLRAPATLSGGERQRLAIAAALASRPAVLVLDEPTAALDPLGAAAVVAALTEVRAAGTTVVLAARDPDLLAALADRVVVLAGGGVALEGSTRAILSRSDALAALGLAAPTVARIAARVNAGLGTTFAPLTLPEGIEEFGDGLSRAGGTSGG